MAMVIQTSKTTIRDDLVNRSARNPATGHIISIFIISRLVAGWEIPKGRL